MTIWQLIDMKTILTGIDTIQSDNCSKIKGKRVALLCHAASYDKKFVHIIDRFHNVFDLRAIFTPQHGLWGHTQANMIEWNGISLHPKYKIPVHSLYGRHRKPTPEMLENIDILIIDLFDVGARYYTYIWTAALCMEACAQSNIEIIVLDRPNPIGGEMIEGPVLSQNLSSFVGLYPLPIRHGMTIGEIMLYLNKEFSVNASLEIIKMHGYSRELWFDQTDLIWFMP